MADSTVVATQARQQMQQMLDGYRMTQLVFVAAKLGLADLLATGPLSVEELAARTGAQAGALERVLRTLASLGVLAEQAPRRFALTPLGDLLRADRTDTMRPLALMAGEEAYRSWAEALMCVMTGAPGFDRVYGANRFAYLAAHPETATDFNQSMSQISRQDAEALVAAYDFSVARTVVDIGGGQGRLLATVLGAYPALRGVLFDQPQVVAGAASLLEAAGVADRCERVGGDFFAAVPPEGDVYVMRSVVHDWDDERCVTILRRCAEALRPDAKLLVIEPVISSEQAPPAILLRDLQMLVMTGGRERTAEEFEALFAAAGLALLRIIPISEEASVLECVRATDTTTTQD